MAMNIFHLVPEYIYKKSINRLGNYNCKGFENSSFIHTTKDLKKLKTIADIMSEKLKLRTLVRRRCLATSDFSEHPKLQNKPQTLVCGKLKEFLIFTKTIKNKNSGKYYEKPSIKFLLLKVNMNKIKARITSTNKICFHIYGSIPKDAYRIMNVKRDKRGRFHFK